MHKGDLAMGVAFQLEPSVDRFVKAPPRKMLIEGKWVDAASGKTFATVESRDRERARPTSPRATPRTSTGPCEAARKAFDDGPWPQMAPTERRRICCKLADLIETHGEELAQLETLDNGKPICEAANVDMPLAAGTFRYYAGWATKIDGETIPVRPRPQFFNYTLREPVGVCGQIIPWNFPLLMAAWKLGPALACGNTVVLKPAEQTPLIGAAPRRAARWRRAFPAGVVNIVTGFGETAGAALVRASGRRQDRVHRLDRGGQAHHARRRRQPEAGLARARRQVAEHRLRRRRPRRPPCKGAAHRRSSSTRASAAAPARACSSSRRSTTRFAAAARHDGRER